MIVLQYVVKVDAEIVYSVKSGSQAIQMVEYCESGGFILKIYNNPDYIKHMFLTTHLKAEKGNMYYKTDPEWIYWEK